MLPTKEWKRMLKKIPMLGVDGVVIKEGHVLLVERKHEPFAGCMTLPGGFVEYRERLEDAVRRETFEETGIKTKIIRLIGIYDNPKRDPRGHLVSTAFLLKVTGGKIKDSNETKNVKFYPLDRLPELGFDHEKMIMDALKIIRDKKKKR